VRPLVRLAAGSSGLAWFTSVNLWSGRARKGVCGVEVCYAHGSPMRGRLPWHPAAVLLLPCHNHLCLRPCCADPDSVQCNMPPDARLIARGHLAPVRYVRHGKHVAFRYSDCSNKRQWVECVILLIPLTCGRREPPCPRWCSPPPAGWAPPR
jgi:hypothetical protein